MAKALRLLSNLRVLVLLLGALPLLVLPALGAVWLWQHGAGLLWVVALLTCSLLAFGCNHWLDRRVRARLQLEPSGPAPHWPPSESAAWARVEAFADALDVQAWPLTDGAGLLRLGRMTVEQVARQYHPQTPSPLLELSVPHLLRIIELAARDVGREVREQIPFSDRLTIGRFIEMKQWLELAQDLNGLWRTGRLVVNPANAVLAELAEQLRNRAFGAVKGDVQQWLLQEYVRRTGRYAIEVYSGRLLFTDGDPRQQMTTTSVADVAADAPAEVEPLRVLVLGQRHAGKSSLVNALVGAPRAAVDAVQGTAARRAYRLEREGMTRALVIDTPGLDEFSPKDRLQAAAEADLILWVCPAHRADRALDRVGLDDIRDYFAARPRLHPPPVLVVMTQIDRLRPVNEWQPPYDLGDERRPKVRNIVDALAAIAQDLAVATLDIVPVCLAPGRSYNVEDVLWAAILERQSVADRARTLRCLDSARRGEQGRLMWQQFRHAGRVLSTLPQRLRSPGSKS